MTVALEVWLPLEHGPVIIHLSLLHLLKEYPELDCTRRETCQEL